MKSWMKNASLGQASERAHTIATLALANEVVVADIEVEADPPGRVHPYWAGLGW